ncbi:succinic semialdehyde dehydrogenase [Corynebacterium accolens]|uniref:succinic semialdehyde dehydrogenase n=1 Tax=Corynebacterium accolens TaxID=38284 RepID=UPI0005504B03|nr:succinic semialdehyde dehydrogenase [Corynebacterium accolens]UQZ28820.1 Putative succinate-semialdehyde dehydrogenase [NADP(+)] 2 [Corynebacterium accolens]WKS56655.1 succinic semialdehyde dehydrogenase [Corynebacterium accolens]
MSLPRRLQERPLPQHLLTELQHLTTNYSTGSLDKGEHQAVHSPLFEEELGWVGVGSEEDVDEAFRRSRQAQMLWADTDVKQRVKVMKRFHHLVAKNRELLADFIQLETGKDRTAAFDEVLDVLNNARYYSNNAPKLLATQKQPGAFPFITKTRLQRVPKGVVGQISPWNYPLALGISDAVAALLAGNGIVAKPDGSTPFSNLISLYLLKEAGLPKDLLQIVTGSGRVVGSAIAERCDYLMFTGSTKTGKILGTTVGERLVGYSAELGGKNPMIIAPDADIDKHIDTIATACFSNSGQLCVSIERIYVPEAIFDQFITAFRRATESIKLGSGLNWDYTMGSLISQDQLDVVQHFVDDAVNKGATVITGGKPRPDIGPSHFEPTVLTDLGDGTELAEQEVFGPVVYVQRVRDVEEAIEQANKLPYGLNSSVFGQPETAQAIAEKIDAGSVTINDGYASTWASISTPLGGVKESGVGRRHGHEGLTKYTEAKNISSQRIMPMRGPSWLPNKYYGTLLSSALRLGKALHFLP